MRSLVAEGERSSSKPKSGNGEEDEEEEEKSDPPRNFTLEQLAYFDGKEDEKLDEKKPVYLSVTGVVFDVSDGRDFYGPGGPYELFAGHECGIALAKYSFDATYLDDLAGCASLSFGEKEELHNWMQKFQYGRGYPIVGRLVLNVADANRVITKEVLAQHDGTSEDKPEGYASPPIYLCAGKERKVFDVSFGGISFYGPGGAYHRFAGKDASRALAKMSFDPEDVKNTHIHDLTEKQLKCLSDWVNTFENRKMYPCVGRLEA